MNVILAADIGSTFTKLTAVDVEAARVIGSARAFTTIETNVMEGFEAAMKELVGQCGQLQFDRKVASSSAAGGLKMIAVGLVPDLTVQAARMAAANAGAKIQRTFSFELNRQEVEEIVALAPDMVLLCGGIDGGNKEVIIHNAKALVTSGLNCSIVVAGNKSANDELHDIFKDYGGEALFCDNVMPAIGELNATPAQRAIRDLFIKNIISAKGLDELAALMSVEIIPTPLAVFEAAKLLSQGTKKTSGLGELMVFDVGGATTDVYSMSEGLPTRANVFMRGLKQPFAKRTVEGDLGLRYSLQSLASAADVEVLAESLGLEECAEVDQWLSTCRLTPGIVAEYGTLSKRIDDALAGAAVRLAAARHCGTIETVFTLMGQAYAQTGKDLGQVGTIIGTGGPIINAEKPAEVLAQAAYSPADMNLLKPVNPSLMVDARYILASMGLLSRLEPETALRIMLEEMKPA